MNQQNYNIKNMSGKAFEILNKSSEDFYLNQKNMIKYLFDKNIGGKYLDKVKLRLAIIDGFYSTNMNKRYYGIEDIASKIKEKFTSDEKFKDEIKKFLENPDSPNKEIVNLIENDYGIHKNNSNAGRATSLLTKYIYFLSGYNFPIRDTLVVESYPKIVLYLNNQKKLNLNKQLNKDNICKFVLNMKKLNEEAEIFSFDRLDNLLWLIGKINNGNLSLIINKKNYKKMIEMFGLQNSKNKNINKEIRKKLKNDKKLNQLKKKNIFNENLIEFIKFVNSLK